MAGRPLPGVGGAPATRSLLVASLVAIVASLLTFAAPAAAQTYTVTNLGDSGVEGDGSLRGELKAANTVPGADTIDFAAGLSGTIALAGSGLTIKESVDIEGPGPEVVTVLQTTPGHRVVLINLENPGLVTIAGLTLTGGETSGSGGDIFNDKANAIADLTVSGSVVSGGRAASDGGGIESLDAPLTLISSTVTGNRAAVSGGIETGGSAGFTIEDSTISGNFAEIEAGGIGGDLEGSDGLIEDATISGDTSKEDVGGAMVYADKSGSFTMRNSTVAGNVAEGDGGLGNGGGLVLGTDTTGTVLLESSTIAANRAEGDVPFGDGGGILANPGNVLLENTIVAGNDSLNGPDLDGSPAAAFSLIGAPTGATVTEAVPGSDLFGVDPQLGPLADNGGPTATMALPPTSPAVNKGGGGPTTDQRGDPRPVIYPGVALSTAPGADGDDIGAYELAAPPASPPPTSPSAGNPPPPLQAVKKKLSAPRVKVSCPKSAAPTGCHFTLQVFSAKPRVAKGKAGRAPAGKPIAESRVTVVNLRPGRSVTPTLTPKPRFAARLDAAKSLLVREAATIGGRRSVSYRRLKVVG